MSVLSEISILSGIADRETGLYYLNSRYYDPEVGRFLNADGYASTGQGVIGSNMFIYCGNNPVNRADPSGQSWGGLFSFISNTLAQIKETLNNLTPVYATCGGVAALDGPLPFGDILGGVAATVTTIGVVTYAITKTVAATPFRTEKTREKVKTLAWAEIPQDKPIYRWGGVNIGNLTPKEKDYKDPGGRGLSFSTVYEFGSAMTTMRIINATGILLAQQDGATHVSVYPVGGTMETWMRQGTGSIWSQALRKIVVKV